METHNHHHSHHNYFYIALFSLITGIFVILIAVVLVIRTVYEVPFHVFEGPENLINRIIPRRSPTTVPVKKGTLTLAVQNEKANYRTGDVVTLIVLADSDNALISGYDVIVSYDVTKVRPKEVKNLQKDFQTFVKKTTVSPVSLTGVKKLDISTPSIFSQTPLAEFSFIILDTHPEMNYGAPVSADFNFGFVPDSTQDSNLIDEKSLDVLGQVRGVTVTIGP